MRRPQKRQGDTFLHTMSLIFLPAMQLHKLKTRQYITWANHFPLPWTKSNYKRLHHISIVLKCPTNTGNDGIVITCSGFNVANAGLRVLWLSAEFLKSYYDIQHTLYNLSICWCDLFFLLPSSFHGHWLWNKTWCRVHPIRICANYKLVKDKANQINILSFLHLLWV